MCGIVGIVGRSDVADLFFDGRKSLEYRGYDSAGIASIHDGSIELRRASGKLDALGSVLQRNPVKGSIGIAHTRWATHGAPIVENAHPHATGEVAVAHSGIIENHKTLRTELLARGRQFTSDTDTEVVTHLLSELVESGINPIEAVREVLPRPRGAFALAIIFRGYPNLMIGARLGSPLVVGLGDGENFLGSDALALAPLTQRVIYLDEGDWAVCSDSGVLVYDQQGSPVERAETHSGAVTQALSKDGYRHFMAKEIHEQPVALARTLRPYLSRLSDAVNSDARSGQRASFKRVTLVACGTSYYAAMVARYWFEQIARIPADVEMASEFRYRNPVVDPAGLALFVSQSGETADTLAALRHAKATGVATAAVVNVPSSSMASEADMQLATSAGPEIGVASTKAFTCQLGVLAAYAIEHARARGQFDEEETVAACASLGGASRVIELALEREQEIAEIAAIVAKARDVLFLGRGVSYPLAMEGALKLKEISYIHAEGYAAGEMKHGPIALIDEQVPVIVLALSGALFEKTISNLQEVRARGGKVILISDRQGIDEAGDGCEATIVMPATGSLTMPLVYSIPVQLLAYHAAILKGTDADQPRNLAKSVTVE